MKNSTKFRTVRSLSLALTLACASLASPASAAVSVVQEIGTASSWGFYPPPPPFAYPDGQLWIEVATPIQAGNRVVVSLAMDPVPGFVVCTDGQDNYYTVDADVTTGSGSSGVRTVVFSGFIRNTVPVADKVLVILPAGVSARAMSATEFSGLSGLAFAYDAVATNVGSGTAMSAGPADTTLRNNELVMGVFGAEGVRNFTSGGAYTSLASTATGSASDADNVSIFSEYQVVSTTGAYTADATLDLSGSWAGAVVTYADVCSNLSIPPGDACDADANDTTTVQLRTNPKKVGQDSWLVRSTVYYPPPAMQADLLAGGAEVAVDLQNGDFSSPIVTHTFLPSDCKAIGQEGAKCRTADGSTLSASPRNGAYRVTVRVKKTSLTIPASVPYGTDSLITLPGASPGVVLPGNVRICEYRNKGNTLLCRQTN